MTHGKMAFVLQTALVGLMLLCCGRVVLHADVITLKSGEKLEGKIRGKTGEKVLLECERGKLQSIPLSRIDKIEEKPFDLGTPEQPKRKPPEKATEARKEADANAGESVERGADKPAAADGAELTPAAVGLTNGGDILMPIAMVAVRLAGDTTYARELVLLDRGIRIRSADGGDLRISGGPEPMPGMPRMATAGKMIVKSGDNTRRPSGYTWIDQPVTITKMTDAEVEELVGEGRPKPPDEKKPGKGKRPKSR